jgi:hypothetical protein
MSLPTDVEVLAEHASEVAVAEEDRARTRPAPQAVFFTVMGKYTVHHGQPPGTAVELGTGLLSPVGMALTRAAGAVGQGLHGFVGPAGKLTAFEKLQVGGPSRRHRIVSQSSSLPIHYCRALEMNQDADN